ncbi:hypothetical protein JHK86_016313 [Glycine max]|nr:hypothetical protein JHK86_016313 [Glycine max]
MDGGLGEMVTVARTCVNMVHLLHVWLLFKLAYVSRELLVMGCRKLWDGFDNIVLPKLLAEVKGFVRFDGEGAEAASGDVLVGLEVAAMEAEGGGVFVEVVARDFDVEGEFHINPTETPQASSRRIITSNMNTTREDRSRVNLAAQEGDIDGLYTVIQENPHVLEDIDSIPFVDTPLHVAASVGHLRFVTEVMRLKPSFAWKQNPEGLTPIHLALQHGHDNVVLRLVSINNDLVRAKGRKGRTPLHLASKKGEIDLLTKFLLACPNCIEDVTVKSETALHIAVRCGQFEALQVLVGWLRRTPP